MKKYDVIIIGAGNGGLAAAATCAKAGLSTLLLERHNIPGGSASSFVRGRFEFEPSLHELAGIGRLPVPCARSRKPYKPILSYCVSSPLQGGADV